MEPEKKEEEQLPPEEADLTEEDEAILDSIWDELAGDPPEDPQVKSE